jgi:DNA-binding MarR family transcriptional regulator
VDAPQRGARVAQEIGRDCLAVRLRLLGRAVSRIYDTALRPHGLTVAQLNLLAAIATRQPVPAGRIAQLLSMEISTLSRNAQLLQNDGLVQIERAGHGNGRLLALTDAGGEKLVELRRAWCDAQKQAYELLGADVATSITRRVDDIFAEDAAVTVPSAR